MSHRIFPTSVFGLLMLLSACNPEPSTSLTDYITVSTVITKKIKTSDLFTLVGFTKLQDAGQQPLRSISKVLFAGNSMIVFDAETDFQEIYRYDAVTGNFINKIGHQSNGVGGYDELYDIDLNTEKDQVVGLSTGNTSLMTYDFQGNLVKQLRIGSLGASFAVLPDGGYVVYNEFSATDISGCHFLVFYDKQGNVVKRSFPYPPSLDSYGYDFTGFLSRSGKDILFSPPFSDTIYAIQNRKAVPLQIFDFQSKAVPNNLRMKKLEAGETNNMSFLNEGAVKSKNLTLFHFMEQYGVSLGIYDEHQKLFLDARAFDRKDPLYELIQEGNIFPKVNDQFALVLTPGKLRYLIANGLLDLSELAETYPELAKSIAENEAHSAYILLYLEAK